jgi:hypothetical protein
MSAVIRPIPRGRDPLACGNHGGVADDRDEIAVPTRLHPDDAEAVLAVLVGDALNQPSENLPVGWLWLRLHGAQRTALVAEALARGAEERGNRQIDVLEHIVARRAGRRRR